MMLKRRDFLGGAAAAGAAGIAPRVLRAQEESGGAKTEVPTYKAKVEQLFKSPDRFRNVSISWTGKPGRSWRISSRRRTTPAALQWAAVSCGSAAMVRALRPQSARLIARSTVNMAKWSSAT